MQSTMRSRKGRSSVHFVSNLDWRAEDYLPSTVWGAAEKQAAVSGQTVWAGAPDVRRGIAEDEASMVSRGQVVESTVCKTKDFNFLA